VGNNPTTIDASSMLEVEATNQGILLPRISIGNIATWGLAGATPVSGMFVYNSNAATTGGSGIGIYYWANAKWNYVQNGAAANTAWLLTGNASTTPGTYAVPGTDFIGTTDGVDFAVRTTNAERMRISAAGQIGVNQNYVVTQQLAVSTGVAANTAIVGQNTTAAGVSTGIGVLGTTLQSAGYGVNGTNGNAAGTAIYGQNTVASGAGAGTGVLGATLQSLGNGVKGTNGNAAGIAILGQNTVASGTGGNGIGVEGLSAQSYNAVGPTNGYGVVALNSNTNGTGLYAGGNNVGLNSNFLLTGSGAALVGTNIGAFGYSTAGAGIGIYGNNTGASGIGVYGVNSNTTAFQMGVYGTYNTAGYGTGVIGLGYNGTIPGSASTIDVGVYGSANDYGIMGYNAVASYSGTGVYGQVTYTGHATNGYYPVAVFGNASANSNVNGTADGVDGYTSQPGGAGVIGINSYITVGATGVYGAQLSNAAAPLILSPVGGAGASFTGNGTNTVNKIIIGVAGFANYSSSGNGAGSALNPSFFAGGYFATKLTQAIPYTAANYAYVAVQNNGTNFKILGTGNVSTVVKDLNNKNVILFAPEGPEPLFEDYGNGVLVNGKAHIVIDPVFAKNISVNDKHPLRVFIQLNGDCNGVFTTNITGKSFDVVELKGGMSNVKFVWHVVGNRADDYDNDGKLSSKNADLRLPPGPGPMEAKDMSQKVKSVLESNNGLNKKPGLNKKESTEQNPLFIKNIQDKVTEDKKSDPPPAPKKD